VTPIYTLGRERTNATYYQDVRVPVSNRVGPENGGWDLITSQLNHERITLATPGFAESVLEEVWRWAGRTPCPEGGSMLGQQWVQLHLRGRVSQGLTVRVARLDAREVLSLVHDWLEGLLPAALETAVTGRAYLPVLTS
jgi:alkylation response protein AidB-like acyl-CoA dehydrogenase